MIKVSLLYFIFFLLLLRLVCNEVVCERDGRSLANDPPVILWGERLKKQKRKAVRQLRVKSSREDIDQSRQIAGN